MINEFEFNTSEMKGAFWFRWCVSFLVLSALTAISVALAGSSVFVVQFISYFALYILSMLDMLLVFGLVYFFVFSKNTVKKIVAVSKDSIIINEDSYERTAGSVLFVEMNSDLFALFPFLSRRLTVRTGDGKVKRSYWFGPCWCKNYKRRREEIIRYMNFMSETGRLREVTEEIANNKIENWSRTEIIFPKAKVRSEFYIEDSLILVFCIAGLLLSMYLKVDDKGLIIMLSILKFVSILCFFVWMIKAFLELRAYRTMPSRIEVGANGIRIDDKMFLKEEIRRLSFNFKYLTPKTSPIPAFMYIYSNGVRYKYYLGYLNSKSCIEPRRVLMIAVNKLFEVPSDKDDTPDDKEDENQT